MGTRTLASLTSAERIRFEGRLEKAEAALEAIDIVGQALVAGRFDLAEAQLPRLGEDGLFDDFDVVEADTWRARCRELHLVLDGLGVTPRGSILARLAELLGRSHVKLPTTKPRFWRRTSAVRFRYGDWLRLGPVVFHTGRALVTRVDADWAMIDGYRALTHVLEGLGVVVPAAGAPVDVRATAYETSPTVRRPRSKRERSPPKPSMTKAPPPIDLRWRERPAFVEFRPVRALRRGLGPVVGPLVLVAGACGVIGGFVHPFLGLAGIGLLLGLLALVSSNLDA
jgi:hypothetical protein